MSLSLTCSILLRFHSSSSSIAPSVLSSISWDARISGLLGSWWTISSFSVVRIALGGMSSALVLSEVQISRLGLVAMPQLGV